MDGGRLRITRHLDATHVQVVETGPPERVLTEPFDLTKPETLMAELVWRGAMRGLGASGDGEIRQRADR